MIAVFVVSVFWNPSLQWTPPKPPPVVAPAPPPPPPPPPPAKPWVTEDEIEQQKRLGRTLVIRSPQELLHLWENGQDLAIFQFKWIKVDYPAAAPPVLKTMEKKEYYVATVYFQADRFLTKRRTGCVF